MPTVSVFPIQFWIGTLLLYHKHVNYEVEHWFGFYPLFGFLAYSFIVFAAHLWRRVVMRGEDYYGD